MPDGEDPAMLDEWGQRVRPRTVSLLQKYFATKSSATSAELRLLSQVETGPFKPNIVVTYSGDPQLKHEIERAIRHDKRVIQGFRERFDVDLTVIRNGTRKTTLLKRAAAVLPSTLGHEPRSSCVVRILKDADSLCGAQVLVRLPSGRTKTCVVGGILLVGYSLLAFTTRHSFEDDDDDDSDESTCGTINSPTFPAFDSNGSFIEFEAPPLGRHVDRGSCLGGLDYDWQFLDLSGMPEHLWPKLKANRVEGRPIKGTPTQESQRSGPVSIITQGSGSIKGYLSSASASVSFGEQNFDARTIMLTEVLPVGCSGSWVTQEDDLLCGYIIATREDFPSAYMIPIAAAMKNMEACLNEEIILVVEGDFQNSSFDLTKNSPLLEQASTRSARRQIRKVISGLKIKVSNLRIVRPLLESIQPRSRLPVITNRSYATSDSTTASTDQPANPLVNDSLAARVQSVVQQDVGHSVDSIIPSTDRSRLDSTDSLSIQSVNTGHYRVGHHSAAAPRKVAESDDEVLPMQRLVDTREQESDAALYTSVASPWSSLSRVRLAASQTTGTFGISMGDYAAIRRIAEGREDFSFVLRKKLRCEVIVLLNEKRVEDPSPAITFRLESYSSAYENILRRREVLLRKVSAAAYIRTAQCSVFGKESSRPFISRTIETKCQWHLIFLEMFLSYYTAEGTAPSKIEFRFEGSELASGLHSHKTAHAFLKEVLDINSRKNWQGQWYIPRKALHAAMSEETIGALCRSDRDIRVELLTKSLSMSEVVSSLSLTSWRLLSICIYAQVSVKYIVRALQAGIDDTKLPLSKGTAPHVFPDQVLEKLCEVQCHFTALQFDHAWQDDAYRLVSDDCIVPIHWKPESDFLGRGRFGVVYKVRIHPEHISFSHEVTHQFAMKMFTASDYHDDAHGLLLEAKPLKDLSQLQHQNLVVPVASWQQNATLSILFQQATSNLETFLKDIPQPSHNKNEVLWFFEQMRGLADALRLIHNVGPSGLAPATPEDGRRDHFAGYHHDIKPANILVFNDSSGRHDPIFKIADFGMSRVAQKFAHDDRHKYSQYGTLRYRPPEEHEQSSGQVSADIWSFGCVLAEILNWMIDPGKLGNDTDQHPMVDKARYLVTACKRRGAFEDLAILIRRMLSIDPQQRPTASSVFNDLDAISLQARNDLRDENFYLLEKENHFRLSAPPEPPDFEPVGELSKDFSGTVSDSDTDTEPSISHPSSSTTWSSLDAGVQTDHDPEFCSGSDWGFEGMSESPRRTESPPPLKAWDVSIQMPAQSTDLPTPSEVDSVYYTLTDGHSTPTKQGFKSRSSSISGNADNTIKVKMTVENFREVSGSTIMESITGLGGGMDTTM